MSKWTPEEQAAHRELWVEALLSGDYPQAEGRLKVVDNDDFRPGFCCLGVACELAVEAGIVEWVETEVGAGYRPGQNDLPQNDTLPMVVMNWLGLYDTSGLTVEGHDDGHGHTVHTLVELNDDLKWDFRRIGELIRAGGVSLQ